MANNKTNDKDSQTTQSDVSSDFFMSNEGLRRDIVRYGTGLLLMCFLFLPFSSNVDWLTELKSNLHIAAYMTGFGVTVSLITHITRRILFPYINLSQYAKKALEEPTSAGMVFMGICIIIAFTIVASAGFFK